MTKIKKIGIILVCLGLIVSSLLFLKDGIVNFFLESVVKNVMSSKSLKLEDGLHAILIGSGSPMPDINRVGPCIAVVAGKKLYIVDAGNGAARNITLSGLNIGKIDALFLTHFHSDHIGGLGEIMLQRWAVGSNYKPLDIIGPIGVEQVVAGFNMAYQLDKGYRIAYRGEETMPPSGAGGMAKTFSLSEEDDASVVLVNEDGIKITAFKVDHKPVVPAVGYKFEYKGRSLVISGDTKYCESVVKQSNNVDVLFHEALNTKLVGLVEKFNELENSTSSVNKTHAPSYHTSPEEVAQIAHKANIHNVVLYHLIPPLPPSLLKSAFLGDAKKYYDGPMTIGVDGTLVSLPANRQDIEIKYLFK